MAYFEINTPRDYKHKLKIEPGHLGTEFEIDCFGMDDGADLDPNQAFRLLFQIGRGYMIYLYVIQMSRPGDQHFFQNFWIKDCAVAEVEMEAYGPPSLVEGGPLELPLLFQSVRIGSVERELEYQEFDIQGLNFEAKTDGDGVDLTAQWRLVNDQTLTWNNRTQWQLDAFDTAAANRVRRPLGKGERIEFARALVEPV